MSNDYVFNDTLPVAPLKIAALESCRDLAEKVNSHIINFRRNDIEVLKKRQENLQYRGYDADSYMLDCACPRFGSGESMLSCRSYMKDASTSAAVVNPLTVR